MTNLHDSTGEVGVALLGYGTVGSALHRAILAGADSLGDLAGRAVMVRSALVRSTSADRSAPTPIRFTTDLDAALADCSVACEAMGGLEPARTFVLSALERGVHVVTANKQLVAAHGPELWAAAARGGSELRYEAAVCGAIPIMRMVRESLAPSQISTVAGIMNGTSNFILTAMSEKGEGFTAALTEAQRLGYAEPDPTDDVSGADAAAKLVLLAGAAFHARFTLDQVRTRGIDQIEAVDIRMAHGLGYEIKSLGRARIERRSGGDTVTLVTGPMLVPIHHGLATVGGATNAVLVAGTPFGELIVQGAGAGGDETASAMLGDLAAVLAGSTRLSADPGAETIATSDPDDIPEPQYARLRVPDRPGILSDVAGRLADAGVSIARVVQDRDGDGTALLVLTTHPAARSAVEAALSGGAETQPPLVLPMLAPDDPAELDDPTTAVAALQHSARVEVS